MSAAPADEALIARARAHHVYDQQALKERLRAGAALPLAFDRYREALHWDASVRLRRLPLQGLRDAARTLGHAFIESEPGGRPFQIDPPVVIGDGNQRSLRGLRRPRFLACLGPARIASRASSLVLADRIVFDASDHERAAFDDRLDLDPAVFAFDASHAEVIVRDEPPALALDEAFSLVGTHSWAFGHWMWEFLPRYVGALRDGLAPMPVLVDAGMPRQHRQALEAAAPAGTRIVELPTGAEARVQRAWVAPTPMYMPQFERMDERFAWDWLAADPAAFTPLVEEMDRRVHTPAQSGDARLFLGRRELRHRRLVNREAIESVAAAHGFQRLYPEDLDFAEQVARVRAASHLAGPEGSAFFLAFFARPGTRVDILNHPYTLGLPVLTGLLEARGLRVRVLTGPAVSSHPELPHFVDYRIEPERFEALLGDAAPA